MTKDLKTFRLITLIPSGLALAGQNIPIGEAAGSTRFESWGSNIEIDLS